MDQEESKSSPKSPLIANSEKRFECGNMTWEVYKNKIY